jgi:hypothetical protein
LRRAFYLAALTAIKVNPVIKRFYEEHKGRLRGKKLIVACARKLAVIIWAVLYYRPLMLASKAGDIACISSVDYARFFMERFLYRKLINLMCWFSTIGGIQYIRGILI